MSIIRLSIFVLLLNTFLVCVSGCTSKANVSPQLKNIDFRRVALLPIAAPPETREGRIEYLTTALRSELKSRGYLLLDEILTERHCPLAPCSKDQIKSLAQQHSINALLSIDIKSISRNNFALGYYNVITGEVILLDSTGDSLFTVTHSESEKGGLVFNSGQIVQGIISTIQNAGDNSFNQLANKFARSLAAQIPDPGANTATPLRTIELKRVNINPIQEGVFQVCADTSPGAIVSILLNRQKTNLRSVSNEQSCGVYRLNQPTIADSKIVVEARSTFGDIVRKEVSIEPIASCDLGGKIKMSKENGKNTLLVNCPLPEVASIKPASDNTNMSCKDGTFPCSKTDIIIYRAYSTNGPFEKIARINRLPWQDKNLPKNKEAVYRVLSVNNRGDLSLPIEPLKVSSK